MEICVIHGSNRKGNTDRTIEIIKETLNAFEEIVYSDVYLHKDLPFFCNGCFLCLETGVSAGENCPHKQYTNPILEKMLRSDGIIIGSPVYALSETAQIKTFFDHFACSYICHRPNEEMFDKIGFVVSTAAGAGTKNVINTVSRNFLFWGIKRIIKCGINIWDNDWENIPNRRRIKFEKKLKSKAKIFYKVMKRRYKLIPNIKTIFLKNVFKKLIESYPCTNPDKIYWKLKEWIIE